MEEACETDGQTLVYLHRWIFMVGCRPGGQLDGGDPEGPDVRLVVVSGHLPKKTRKDIIDLIQKK